MQNVMRIVLLALMACLVLCTVAAAKVPTVVNYQGRLTDATGAAVVDGSYSVRFRIYDTNVAGTLIWEEIRSVTANGGFIDVLLGEISPLDTSLFNESERWLGIKVGADAEMTPRVRLASTPFALTAGQAGALMIDPYVNEYGDTLRGSLLFRSSGADAGGIILSTDAADLNLSDNGFAKAYIWGSSYGELGLYDSDGDATAHLNATSNVGGKLELATTDGDVTISLSSGASGDLAVVLPDDAIHSDEIMNEAGIASSNNSSITTLTTTMQDLETVTITIPDAGYIVVEAKCYGSCSGTTAYNKGFVQIDETTGGYEVYPYYTLFGMAAFAGTGTANFPMYVTRVYHKTSAGTYTFRLEGRSSSANDALAVTKSGDHILTATYYPSSYGTVEATVSAEEASAFDQATPITPGEREGGMSIPSIYKVDLRELELKAKQARIKALEAELELRRAREEAARQERAANE